MQAELMYGAFFLLNTVIAGPASHTFCSMPFVAQWFVTQLCFQVQDVLEVAAGHGLEVEGQDDGPEDVFRLGANVGGWKQKP